MKAPATTGVQHGDAGIRRFALFIPAFIWWLNILLANTRCTSYYNSVEVLLLSHFFFFYVVFLFFFPNFILFVFVDFVHLVLFFIAIAQSLTHQQLQV